MNTYKFPSNNKEVENVSTRVKNTKKEIELLKADLEKLINSGVRSVKSPSKENEVCRPVIQPIEPIRHSPAIKKNVEVSQSKPETKKDSPKKPKSYDVAQAREYIKKQKEKRAEQLKAQINVADNKIDLKKQKLKELHQKTLELVSKNVQLKRERSKSREREPPVRPDKSNLAKPRSQERFKKSFQENLRAKSQETLRQKSQDRVKVPQQNPRQKSQERVLRDKSQDNVQKVRPNAQKLPSNSRNKSQETVAQSGPPQERSEAVVNARISRPRTRREKPAPPSIFSISGRQIDTNLLYPPDLKLQKTDVDVDFEKTTLPPFDTNKIDLNKRITERHTRLEHSVMTDACFKDSKETQTNNLAEPVWLKPPPALPYPYNFINTVKRKLQYAINSPNCVDVGVQNSDRDTPEIESKSKEEIKELLIKSAASDLKSFASHKCPNLDLKAVENLELKKSKEIVSRNLFADYESESDTSKNIPDISSESLESSRKNKGDSEPILSLHRLRNLKLHPHKLTTSKSSSNIKTDSNGYPEWGGNNNNNNYSSDFLNESQKSRSSGSIKTVTGGGKVSHVTDNNNSSIKTVASEKKQPPQFLIPSNSSILSANRSSYKSVTKTTGNHLPIEDPSGLKSLLIEGQTSGSTVESHSDYGSTISKSTSISRVDRLALKEPTISLSYKKDQNESSSSVTSNNQSSNKNGSKSSVSHRKEEKDLQLSKSKMKNITIRPAISTNNEVNEIHLKFEAEVRLLSDFNESFKQFMAVEKAFENLKNKNDANLVMTKLMQNVDTQTSLAAKTSTNVTTAENSPSDHKNPTINFSRGSDIIEELNDSIHTSNRNQSKSLQNSSFSTDFDISNLNRSSNTNVSTEEETKVGLSVSNVENYNVQNCAGLSLNMFEQLIKDEDTRIQHLKAIIKIREQALLDRTKGELVWLEIQKKQLIETGKIEEASLLKKKQRGIILKHEQERNEIKKLNQMQKEASEERKNILKRQRNLIKSQLSTDKMLSKIRVKTPRERRSSGPLRVVQSCSESIHSETSISRRSSAVEEVLSVTSRSVRVSEIESELDFSKEADRTKAPVTNAKRALLMREAALQKRRKAAEELLRWHRKLLDEEKKIAELEAAATSVIKRMPKEAHSDRYRFSGKQLNQLWRNMTGRDDGKFVEDKVYAVSQMTLERLCKCARQYASKNKKTHAKNSDVASASDSDSANKTKNYSSVFEPESVQEIINSQEEKTKISSISELIDNFTRIEDEISLISRKSELDITSLEEQIETLPREESKDLDALSQPSTKSSSRASVLTTMTPNHLSEPGDIHSVKTQEIEEIESTTAKNEEIVSNHVEGETETGDKQVTEIEETAASKTAEERSSSPKTESTIEDQEEIISEKIVEESTERSHLTSAIEASSSPKTELTVDQEEIASEKIVEESTNQSHVTSTISEATEASPEIISSQIEARESTESEIEAKESTASAISSQSEEKESTETPQSAVSPEDATKEPSGVSEATKEDSRDAVNSIETTESAVSSKEEIPPLALDEALESASKIEESLSKLNDQLSVEKEEVSKTPSQLEEIQTEDLSTSKEIPSSDESRSEERTSQKKSVDQIDVKKRVSEILADASHSPSKSPRVQDLYVTAYDVGAPSLPEFAEPLEDGRPLPTNIFGSEAEELWRKQLAIEQEIKQLEQQQKEQLPYVFMREIPNKPPPPYTPPSSLSALPQSILPSSVKEVNEISDYSSKVLYKAYLNNTLEKVKFSENGFKLFSKVEVTKICAEFAFNICRDIAREHYKQFEKIEKPSWLTSTKKPQLAKTKPPDAAELDKIMNRKLRELFGFKSVQLTESAIIKWGRKKRDHVDEILVIESQEEESQWTNFDSDELFVKDQITKDIMKMLIDETTSVFSKILCKKKSVVG